MTLRVPGLILLLFILPAGAGHAMSTAPGIAAPTAPILTLPPAPALAPVIIGVLTKDVIRRVIYVHSNEIRNCYQQELQMRPALSGRVIVRFQITDRGQVRELSIQKTTIRLPSLHLCLSDVIEKWSFPATRNQGVTLVSYPFLLRPRPKAEPEGGVKISDEELERLGVHKESEAPQADILFQ